MEKLNGSGEIQNSLRRLGKKIILTTSGVNNNRDELCLKTFIYN